MTQKLTQHHHQVVHGLSIPMAKLGFLIPRTLSNALSSQREDDPEPFHIQNSAEDATTDIEQRLRRRPGWSRNGGDSLPRRVVRIGRSIISSGTSSTSTSHSRAPSRPLSTVPSAARDDAHGEGDVAVAVPLDVVTQPALTMQRMIRFPDEETRVERKE